MGIPLLKTFGVPGNEGEDKEKRHLLDYSAVNYRKPDEDISILL